MFYKVFICEVLLVISCLLAAALAVPQPRQGFQHSSPYKFLCKMVADPAISCKKLTNSRMNIRVE